MLTWLQAAARACLQDVYFPHRAGMCQGNPKTPLGLSSFQLLPCRIPQPRSSSTLGCPGGEIWDQPALLDALTAAGIVQVPETKRKKLLFEFWES